MDKKSKVGDVVWYEVANTREQARIVAISGPTHVRIKLLTGPQSGQVFEAPWGIVVPVKK